MKWIFNFKTKVQKRVLAQVQQKKMHKVGAKKREFGNTCSKKVVRMQKWILECMQSEKSDWQRRSNSTFPLWFYIVYWYVVSHRI